MTTVTIRKQKYNLEETVQQALNTAPTIRLSHYDQADIENHPEMEHQIRFAKALTSQCNWAPRYEKLADVDMNNIDDIINAVGALLKIWNRRAGTRALVSKYGKTGAENIIYKNTRKQVTLRG